MIRLAVRCAPEYAEQVLANLLELAPERGRGGARARATSSTRSTAPPGEVPELGELEAAAGGGLVEVTTTAVPDDWADRWRDFHRPSWSPARIGVRPSWWDAAGAG